MAEIIPFEPDTGNAGVGSGKTKTVIGAISYEGKRVWLLFFNVGAERPKKILESLLMLRFFKN